MATTSKIVIIVSIAFFLFVIGIRTSVNTEKNTVSAVVTKDVVGVMNKHQFRLLVADTDSARQVGLSNRDSLDENEGMLFIFDRPQIPAFWMKDMRFPIDIIWIQNSTVIGVQSQVPVAHDDYFPTYKPSEPITQVVEINAGLAEKYGISVGTQVELTK